jgi:hypothetical protein
MAECRLWTSLPVLSTISASMPKSLRLYSVLVRAHATTGSGPRVKLTLSTTGRMNIISFFRRWVLSSSFTCSCQVGFGHSYRLGLLALICLESSSIQEANNIPNLSHSNELQDCLAPFSRSRQSGHKTSPSLLFSLMALPPTSGILLSSSLRLCRSISTSNSKISTSILCTGNSIARRSMHVSPRWRRVLVRAGYAARVVRHGGSGWKAWLSCERYATTGSIGSLLMCSHFFSSFLPWKGLSWAILPG